MEELLILGGSFAFVLLFVWAARRWWFSGSNSFYLDEVIYTRHSDGHYVIAGGGRIADPALIARLDEEWSIVTNAHLLRLRGYGGILPKNYDPKNPPPPPQRNVLDDIGDVLNTLPH